MVIRFKHVAYSWLLVSLLASCALQVPPSGGDRDMQPPQLQSVSPPDASTDFQSSTIEFTFDENLQLIDLQKQLVVSPPLKNTPIVKTRKKRLLVQLDDTLEANTTYAFHFGNAVADLNEGNPVKDLTYVLSTGDHIDSLSVCGKAFRAEDLKPEKDAWAMLYPAEANDSCLYRDDPRYFSRINDSGAYCIRNIAPGNYRIFLLGESDGNHRWDSPEDRIGFLNKTVAAGDAGINLTSFQKLPSPRVVKVSADGPGRIIAAANRPYPDFRIQWLSDTSQLRPQHYRYSAAGDTVFISYLNTEADSATLVFTTQAFTDTFSVSLPVLGSSASRKKNFQSVLSVSSASSGRQRPDQPLTFSLNHPIRSMTADRMLLTEESTGDTLTGALTQASDAMSASLAVSWKEESRYKLLMLPGAFTDIYGLTHDTVVADFVVSSVSDFATLKISLPDLSAEIPAIIQLVDANDNVLRSTVVKDPNAVYFDFLAPQSYRIKCVFDSNANGRWDTGDDLLHIQPERVSYYAEKLTLRANWDMDIKWYLKP